MSKKRIGPRPIYSPDKNCFNFGVLNIYELEEFLGLQLRWIDTNVLASYDEKEEEWGRLVWAVRRNRMYEWKDSYIHDYFLNDGKMYLPARIYHKLIRGIQA